MKQRFLGPVLLVQRYLLYEPGEIFELDYWDND